MFMATNTSSIAAIGFYALVPQTRYSIYVYTNSTIGEPRSGNLATSQDGTVDEWAGFYTIPLTRPVAISSGKRFSIVVKLTTPNYGYQLAYEKAIADYSSEATAAAGQTFLSSNGSSWSDFTQIDGSASFCCKAYTRSAPPPAATLSSIAISGVTSLTSGQSAQFTCEATYSDGSKKAVSPTWSIARAGQAYATVSASGLVTAKTVSAQQTVTVQASYTEGGITKTATWGMYVTIAAPSAPTGVTATQGTEPSCVRVNWTAPSGATEYAVYRATVNNSKNAKYLENVTVPHYNDTSAVPGIDYWYFIKAKNSSGVSGFSAGASGWRKISPPGSVTASDTLLDKVALEWSEVEGAKYYRVYRATSMDGVKMALGSGWQTATTFNDTTATAGVTYYYFVVAAVNASGSRPSDYSIVEDGMRAKTVTIDRLELKGDATINAGAQADYTADAIYSDGHKVANITPGSWEIVGEGASVVGGRVSAATVTENKTVVLKATYTEGGKTVRGEKQIAIAAVKPVAPRNVAVTAEAQGVTLTWSAVAGAASYAIYRDGVVVGRVIPNAPDAPATTYTDNTAVPGVTYAYCVAAANGAGEGPQSSPAVTAAIPLPAPADVTATSDRTDGVLVDWRRVMDNAPYQSGTYYFRVSRATSATGAKTDLGSWQTGTSYLDTSATAGTRYWYFVRAATSSGGANASDWSAGVVGRVVPNAPTLSSISISGPDKVSASKTAMYTCTAVYSDGTSKSVSPTWSVSGAATIDANGKLTANAVSANSTATITASFTDGTTKTANKAVTVIAPIRATAEVRNINVASRWPFSSLLDIDYELVTDPASAKAMVSVIGRDEDHNVDMAAKTLSGDGANGSYIAAGQHRLTWNIGADYTNFHAKAFSVTMTAAPSIIGVPEDVTASSSTSGVMLSWNAVEDATDYEVWRGTGTTTNGATRIATVTGATTYFDGTGVAGTTYRYWLRASGEDGVGEFAQPITGTRVVIIPTSLTISGASSVTTGSSATYTCTVTRNDSTSGTITPTWSITSGSSYASISSSGVFTANATATQRSVTIQASYTQNGTTVTATKTITINTKSVTITFNANGGSVSPSSQSYTAYGTYGSLPTATRPGYTFAGWYTDASGGTSVTTASTVPASATTLYAHWTVNTYTVTYAPGSNGTGTQQTATKTHDVALTLRGATFTRTGYTQTGWATSDGGSKVYSLSASYAANAAVTLYPFWTANTYAVTLDQQGGSGGMTSVTATYGSAMPSITVPTRSGYTFGGYYTGTNGSGTQYYTASGASARNWDKTSTTTLYAKWTANTYTVTLDRQSGSGGSSSVTAAYGSAMPSITVPTRSGYTFGGYYTGTNGSGTQYYNADGTSAKNWNKTSATTLYAKWTKIANKVQLWAGGPYWADTNVGAENPEDYGYYFWWGDTIGYKRENNKWVATDGSSSNFSFESTNLNPNTPTYNRDIATLKSEGWITSGEVLAPEHDAAHVHWGGNWRMPTRQELDNLNSKCSWNWTTKNEVKGWRVSGTGDYASNSIFLPCAGYGSGTSLYSAGSYGGYWSSVPYPDTDSAWYLDSGWGLYSADGSYLRFYGQSVRPVQRFTN